MKIHFLSILTIFTIFACTKNDAKLTNNNSDRVEQSEIYGWWYRGLNSNNEIYKAFYFGSDGTFKQDMTNLGLGIGTGRWSWESNTIIKVIPDVNGGISGSSPLELRKLTRDSLCGIIEKVKYSRTNHD